MERIQYRISLDLFDTTSQKVLKAKKGDTACDIIITLTENGKVYQIDKDCSAILTAKKPDGNFLYHSESCEINNNTIIYRFTEQTTPCEGMVDCEVILRNAEGSLLLTSPRFSLLVGSTVYNGEDIISTPEYDAMGILDGKVEEIKGYAESASASAEAAAEAKRLVSGLTGHVQQWHGEAEEARDEAQGYAEDAEESAELAEIHRQFCNNYRESAAKSAEDAEASAQEVAEAKELFVNREEFDPNLLINTTTTEEVSVISLDAGRKLTNWITVYLEIPKASAAKPVTVLLDNAYAGYISNGLNTSATFVRFSLRWNGRRWESYSVVSGSATTGGNVYSMSVYSASKHNPTSIQIKGESGGVFPVGTKYLIYAGLKGE